jgi:hypothetical protein
VHTTSPTSSSHSTAILTSDQSHHSPPRRAPPSSVTVIGPLAFSAASTFGQASWGTSCQRQPRSRNHRRRKPNIGHSSIGSTQAACDQYSKAPPLQ